MVNMGRRRLLKGIAGAGAAGTGAFGLMNGYGPNKRIPHQNRDDVINDLEVLDSFAGELHESLSDVANISEYGFRNWENPFVLPEGSQGGRIQDPYMPSSFDDPKVLGDVALSFDEGNFAANLLENETTETEESRQAANFGALPGEDRQKESLAELYAESRDLSYGSQGELFNSMMNISSNGVGIDRAIPLNEHIRDEAYEIMAGTEGSPGLFDVHFAVRQNEDNEPVYDNLEPLRVFQDNLARMAKSIDEVVFNTDSTDIADGTVDGSPVQGIKGLVESATTQINLLNSAPRDWDLSTTGSQVNEEQTNFIWDYEVEDILKGDGNYDPSGGRSPHPLGTEEDPGLYGIRDIGEDLYLTGVATYLPVVAMHDSIAQVRRELEDDAEFYEERDDVEPVEYAEADLDG